MKPLICFIGILFPIFSLNAQKVYEDFEQHEYSISANWLGDTSYFVVNEESKLQLLDSSENILPRYLSKYFLASPLREKEWLIDIQLDFPPSSSNKFRYYLAATNASLMSKAEDNNPFEAYYLEIGESGTADGISLFYENDSSTQLLAKGGEGLFSQPFEKTIKIKIDTSSKWSVFSREKSEKVFNSLFELIHTSNMESSHLGLKCFFTASRSASFFFDNIYFGPIIQDTVPPEILSFQVFDEQSLHIKFNEPVDFRNQSPKESFVLMPGNINPERVDIYGDSLSVLFLASFQNGMNYQLSLNNIFDTSANELVEKTIDFQYIKPIAPVAGDLIITEIMADPSPVAGLPENEFIELYNSTLDFLDLSNIVFSDNSTSSGLLPQITLGPKEYLILCPQTAFDDFSSIGKAASPDKWPALNNGSDSLKLRSASGEVLIAMAYDRSWYIAADKVDGGYSLEIINPALSCFDPANWHETIADQGGTPGQVNSVNDSSFYGQDPILISYELLDSQSLALTFDQEILEYSEAELISIEVYINEAPNPGGLSVDGNQLLIDLSMDLVNGLSYELQLKNIRNCHGSIAAPIIFSFIYDVMPPQVTDIYMLSDSILLISFDEGVFMNQSLTNFYLLEDTMVFEVQKFAANQILLTTSVPFANDKNYQLCVSSIADSIGNKLEDECFDILYKTQPPLSFNSLIITELMVKPIENSELPFSEYVEIYNPQMDTIPLVGLFLADDRDSSELPINYLAPKQYLILCPINKSEQFIGVRKVIALNSWPNLNNTGDRIRLMGAEGSLINEVAYDKSWYRDFIKEEEGGWSLEMVDPGNPCAGKSNWSASIAESHGTPGMKNSVYEPFVDTIGPLLLDARSIDSIHILLRFSEVIRGSFEPDDFELFPAKPVLSIIQKDQKQLILTLGSPLIKKVKYEIKVARVYDCVGNSLHTEEPVYVVLPEKAEVGDLVINEFLFDPLSGGVDFIELYNRSDKYLELGAWVLANKKESIILDFDQLIIAPYAYQVLTESPDILMQQYASSVNKEALQAHELPNMPNGEGQLLLFDSHLVLHDEVIYDEDMHSIFLHSTEGVSLERIHPEAASLNRDSWSSAASSEGYATPGNSNSQLSVSIESVADLTIEPVSFSPNRPGQNYTLIKYKLSIQSAMATLKVFNSKGQEIKTIANNASIGTEGFFRWDGDDSAGLKVGVGYYIIYFSYYSANGELNVIKKLVAVAAG